MKKRFACCAIFCMLISLAVNGTLAYFTAEDTARNVVTSGGIDIQVVEQQRVDGSLQAYPEDVIEIMPGSCVSKVVSVKNLDEPAWIRVSCSLTVLDEDEEEVELSDSELKRSILFDTDTTNWTYKEGWWYYNQALEVGGETKPLFTEVEFSAAETGNEYQNCTLLIDVVAQAVQKANNGSAVMEAAGWPES